MNNVTKNSVSRELVLITPGPNEAERRADSKSTPTRSVHSGSVDSYANNTAGVLRGATKFINSYCHKIDWSLRLTGSQLMLGWAQEQRDLFNKLHTLPSVEWFDEIISPSVKVRVEAYRIYDDAVNNPSSAISDNAPLIAFRSTWEGIEKVLRDDPQRPTALISARCLVYRVLGDVTPEEALKKARSGFEALKEENQQRKFTGPILRRYHNLLSDGSGSEYESERKIIQGNIKQLRAIFDCLYSCLRDENICEGIFSVPKQYYSDKFPEVMPIGEERLDAMPPESSLFERFNRMTRNNLSIQLLSVVPDSSNYEMVELPSRAKKS